MIPPGRPDRQPLRARDRVIRADGVTIGASMQRSADMRLVLPVGDDNQRADWMRGVEHIDD
jgi:hypothetical protein